MSESGKITPSQLSRTAVIYVRQSTLAQLQRNTESTARQYDLVARARQLGWPTSAIRVVDGDLGVSGSVLGQRDAFENLVAEVALGQVGMVLALEVSRLARDNAAWYRLLDLAGVCDTLVCDGDGVYHPALFNDRLLLGMKGIMSEAELHVLRARLEGGIKNKASRGALRRGLPVGLVWGEADGEICFHPDAAVTGVITAVFEQFAVRGSVRATWLWLRDQGLRWPLQHAGYLHNGGATPEITWVEPTYHAVHTTLTHPAYAGAYVYGRTRDERYLDAGGVLRKRRRRLPRDRWEVLITDHHPGFIDWDAYLANQQRIGTNIRPQAHDPGTGAVREGRALLQGLATCGVCGRKLAVFYRGPAKSVPNYYCQGPGALVDGRGTRHLNVGGLAIDAAVAEAFVAALAPAALKACLTAAQQLQDGHDAALGQWRRQAEQARYAATKAERRYRAVDPDNRLVADTLEADWNDTLRALQAAQDDYQRASTAAQAALTDQHKARIRALASDFPAMWSDPATPQRERKRMARLLIDDVTLTKTDQIHLHVRFRGGTTTSLAIPIPPTGWQTRQTNPDTLTLLDRLLEHHTDAEVAELLNQASHRSGEHKPFTGRIVLELRRFHQLPSHRDRLRAAGMLTPGQLAQQLGVHPSTIKHWHHAGLLTSHKANDKNERLYQPPTPGDPRLVKRMGSRLATRVRTQPTPGGAV